MKTLALLLMLVISTAANAAEKTVTLDVKDADVRDILQSMKEQCGIRNLVIDADVKGKGTRIIFKEVPCPTAFKVVLRQFNLAGQYDTSMTTVETRKR